MNSKTQNVNSPARKSFKSISQHFSTNSMEILTLRINILLVAYKINFDKVTYTPIWVLELCVENCTKFLTHFDVSNRKSCWTVTTWTTWNFILFGICMNNIFHCFHFLDNWSLLHICESKTNTYLPCLLQLYRWFFFSSSHWIQLKLFLLLFKLNKNYIEFLFGNFLPKLRKIANYLPSIQFTLAEWVTCASVRLLKWKSVSDTSSFSSTLSSSSD